jgi:NitT/TauT family transport system permease protein
MNALLSPFTLDRRFSLKFLTVMWCVLLTITWILLPSTVGFPSPAAVLDGWNRLALQHGLLTELGSSITLSLEALILSGLISWLLAVLYTADLLKPVGSMIGSLRFLGFTGLTFLFTLWTSSQHSLKLSLLVFGMTVFLTRSMIDVVRSTPQSEIDYARSLGLSGWGLTWELMIRGRAGEMLDLIRQNAAMGWTMLTMVEGITRSAGGVGAMLLDTNKHFDLGEVFAIQLTILAYGISQDFFLTWIRAVLCPWTTLNRSDK